MFTRRHIAAAALTAALIASASTFARAEGGRYEGFYLETLQAEAPRVTLWDVIQGRDAAARQVARARDRMMLNDAVSDDPAPALSGGTRPAAPGNTDDRFSGSSYLGGG